MTVTDLSAKVGLSKTPCQIRLKKLIDQGYIRGFRAILNPQKLGLDHIAFVEVRLSDTREKALAAFNAAVMKLNEVEECHMIAGSYDYLLKVRTSDIKSYRMVLGGEDQQSSQCCQYIHVRRDGASQRRRYSKIV
jgi:Lrp/AsnC family leucine-responsive transcriptional regulator